MRQHIGGSRKRILHGDVTPKGRQIIGRIGIGLLAIAQLGFRFYVSSSVEGDPTRFVAEVNLTPFHKDDTALHSRGLLDDSDKVEIGSLTLIKNIPEESNAHYTVITIPDVKKGIISEINGAVKKIIGVPEKLSIASKRIDKFEELVEVVRSSKRAYTALDGYYYMLWELALLCPVNYLDNGPFDSSRQTIEHSDSIQFPHIESFKVIVDGIEIRRPQLFPTPRTPSPPDPIIYPLNFDRQIAGRRLRFSGYIYSQQAQIEPDELKGLHIRIRKVGIGRYDKSWLGYPFDEEVQFGQISGEIYVEDGLESALNIDRDSFIETHVHYTDAIIHEKDAELIIAREREYRDVEKHWIRQNVWLKTAPNIAKQRQAAHRSKWALFLTFRNMPEQWSDHTLQQLFDNLQKNLNDHALVRETFYKRYEQINVEGLRKKNAKLCISQAVVKWLVDRAHHYSLKLESLSCCFYSRYPKGVSPYDIYKHVYVFSRGKRDSAIIPTKGTPSQSWMLSDLADCVHKHKCVDVEEKLAIIDDKFPIFQKLEQDIKSLCDLID